MKARQVHSIGGRPCNLHEEVRFAADSPLEGDGFFLKGERIAAHLRASGNHRHTTVSEHMPSSHRRYADWTVERIRREAASIGPAAAALCELIRTNLNTPSRSVRRS
jgi:hypothetical protein